MVEENCTRLLPHKLKGAKLLTVQCIAKMKPEGAANYSNTTK